MPSTDHVFDRYWSGDIIKGVFNNKTGLFNKKFWSSGSVSKEEDPDCDRRLIKTKFAGVGSTIITNQPDLGMKAAPIVGKKAVQVGR